MKTSPPVRWPGKKADKASARIQGIFPAIMRSRFLHETYIHDSAVQQGSP